MNEPIPPTAILGALPASRPFIAPEELARRAGYPELLRLGANESSFGPPPRALEAMRRELHHTSWYGDPESTDLRTALAARHGCAPENVMVAAGIDDFLGLVVRAYLSPGDVTVATAGTYPTYAYHVFGFGARYETVPYAPDFRPDLPALAERAHQTAARIAYVANPDNPSGSFVTRQELLDFVEALPATTLLVLDEAYADFVSSDELMPATIDPRVVRFRTFSKAYGLAGARIGYALGVPEILEEFAKIRLQFNVNRTAQIGALAALDEPEFVASVMAEIAAGRDEYAAFARERGLNSLPSRTNFVCIDLGSRERAEAMLETLLRLGVFIRKPHAPPLDRYVRVTVGNAAERKRFFALFDEALAQFGAGALP